MARTIVLAGALDTKGEDFLFVKSLLKARGFRVLVVDIGVLGEPKFPPDIPSAEVARAGGDDLEQLRAARDKTRAMRVMTEGLTRVVRQLYEEGRLDGILGMGGSGGTAVITAAMRGLPIGVPKVMVSTVASGDVSAYVGTRDIVMFPSIVDVAGINRISRQIYTNAAGAIAGMVRARERMPAITADKPIIVASMFGNTTPCVDRVRERMEQAGYEVLVFHATGTGGRIMEMLIEEGFVDAVADITTTELADEIAGGVLSAGPDRLFAAARKGLPTVLVPGCVDMVNFWARSTVPEHYRSRLLYEWNPNVTLMRTTPEENRRIGEWIARAANASTGPVAILLPLKGVSMLDSPGEPFWDPEADRACYEAIKANVRPGIPVFELDHNINDTEFADYVADTLLRLIEQAKAKA
ncbi:MAG: Tm-1-like ATP-binding domain-containing protein [Anaerolineae bacterium]|nr:Tm-1-like ATP-binding domain-containing protein [Anaerolineae bacterium]